MQRAYATLTCDHGAADPVQRIITGIATTPTPDRMGDIVESQGAQFALPIPRLWQLDSEQPIGTWGLTQTVAPSGITVTWPIRSKYWTANRLTIDLTFTGVGHGSKRPCARFVDWLYAERNCGNRRHVELPFQAVNGSP